MLSRCATTRAAFVCCLLLSCLVSAAEQPTLRTIVTPERISIDGHTTSEAHELLLRRTIQVRAPSLQTEFNWQRSRELPTGWTLITEFAVRAATLLEHGNVSVTGTQITVSGTSPDRDRLDRTLARLQPLLLPGMTVESKVVAVSAAPESFAVLCERQLLGVSRNYAIEFSRDQASLEAGSEPALQRLVEIFANCPSLRVAVIGYTDRDEDDNDQQALRLARAEAVRESLASRGIDRRRLLVISGTLASDATSRGQRLSKRRVEFAIDPHDQA